jgi:hypothetical protein
MSVNVRCVSEKLVFCFEWSFFAAVDVLTDKWGFHICGLDSVGKRIIKTKIRYQ